MLIIILLVLFAISVFIYDQWWKHKGEDEYNKYWKKKTPKR